MDFRAGLLTALILGAALPAAPQGRPGPPPRPGERRHQGPSDYSLEQACSDEAQLHTLAFSALAFLTGDFGASTFLPPGKAADFFGFQYLRDVDAAGKGHNPLFLDRAAGAVMGLLTPEQRRVFEREAAAEAVLLERLARLRWPLVAAFHRALAGDLPPGCAGLDREAVRDHGRGLFELDARIAWGRARAFGEVARSLSPEQRRAWAGWTFGDFRTWPETDREAFRGLRPRGATRLESVAYMTLCSEFLSWAKGSVEADAYFCPERHGTYFGGFHLKDMPIMGKRDADIPTSLTGDTGEAFLRLLDPGQRDRLERVVEDQRGILRAVVEVRREISTRLRGFLTGDGPPEAVILALGRRYGELDGELAYRYAQAFAALGRSLDDAQRAALRTLRGTPSREAGHAFVFSDRVPLAAPPGAGALLGCRP